MADINDIKRKLAEAGLMTDMPSLRAGVRVAVTARDVTAYGTVLSFAGNVEVELDGTGQVVWVPPTIVTGA
jgi:hypothetical protein